MYQNQYSYKYFNDACPYCTRVKEATTGNVPKGNYSYGDEYTCEVGDSYSNTFFVLENNTDTVSLIMGSNLGIDGKAEDELQTNNRVAWISKEDYIAAGGTESDWGTNGNNNKGPITVTKALKEYTSTWTNITQSQITLPTYDQIYKAAGNKSSDLPSWLYDNLSLDPAEAAKGYWTSTPSQSNTSHTVLYLKFIASNEVYNSTNFTIRPVITISKSLIK